VQDQDNLLYAWPVECFFHQHIAFADVQCAEQEGSLDQALDNIKYYTVPSDF
jgi:hypothetical protein